MSSDIINLVSFNFVNLTSSNSNTAGRRARVAMGKRKVRNNSNANNDVTSRHSAVHTMARYNQAINPPFFKANDSRVFE